MSLAGCLKDKAYEDQEIQSTRSEGSPKIVELKLTANSSKNFLVEAFPNSNNDTTVELLPVNLATPDVAPEDINVTVAVDAAVVDKYNTDNSTSYDVPTSSMYTLVNPTVTIPKGSHTGYLKLKFKSSDYLGNEWALGFKITSVDKQGYTISGNLNWSVVALTVKNQWDGVYHAEGHFQHPTSPRDFDNEKEPLATVGPNTINKLLGDLGDPTSINVTINSNNTVTITPGPGNTGTTATVANLTGNATYNNTYDPATKTFWLHYGYPIPGPSRIITEKVTYVKSR